MNLKELTKDKERFIKEIESQLSELSNRMSVSHPHEGSLEPKCYFMTVTFTESALISCPKKRLEYVRNMHEKFFMRLMGKALKSIRSQKIDISSQFQLTSTIFLALKKGTEIP